VLVGIDEQRYLAGQRGDAANLVADRTQLGLEGDRIERGSPVGQRLLAILVPEKSRVGQPRAHHALVAGAHLRRVAALDVAHGDEMRPQLAGGVLHGEVALVLLQRGDQDFARQIEEAPLERAGDGGGPFHQRGDFVEQRIVEQGFARE
jgi:hypothetical protein